MAPSSRPGPRRKAGPLLVALVGAAAVAAGPGAAWVIPARSGATWDGPRLARSAGRGRLVARAAGDGSLEMAAADAAAAAADAAPAMDGSVNFMSVFNVGLNLYLAVAISQLAYNFFGKRQLYRPEECLAGRDERIPAAPPQQANHLLLGNPLYPPFPDDTEQAMFAFGCFWCSENIYMRMKGVYSTAVGYSGGVTANPTYEEVCGGKTNHAEVVRVVYRPSEVSYEELLRKFWEAHDPTTENKQGNDFGTPYRSAIYYYSEEQRKAAEATAASYGKALQADGLKDPITTSNEYNHTKCDRESYIL